MGNLGFIFWLIGLSLMTFFAVAWLLDISNRQRQLQERVEQISTEPQERDPSAALTADPAHLEPLQREINQLKTHFPHVVQSVGLVRFQAFSDYGGDQSFALALSDAAGNGVVVSSIYAREGARVYAKPLQAWSSSYSLSSEEEQAIHQAQRQIEG